MKEPRLKRFKCKRCRKEFPFEPYAPKKEYCSAKCRNADWVKKHPRVRRAKR